ncbi:MAG TPA: hypothetical protein VNW90_28395 [Acetobacteraceae bacterium]|nr:hypothetical protein [Acetobacteraceae bacterium]
MQQTLDPATRNRITSFAGSRHPEPEQNIEFLTEDLPRHLVLVHRQ